jgi:hypothetical protein
MPRLNNYKTIALHRFVEGQPKTFLPFLNYLSLN